MEEEEQEAVLEVDEVEVQASKHGPLGDDSVFESIGLCNVYVWGPTSRERQTDRQTERRDRERERQRHCRNCVCRACVWCV